MNNLYTFTAAERAVVQRAYVEYVKTLGILAEIHGVQHWALAPDQSGFIEQPKGE